VPVGSELNEGLGHILGGSLPVLKECPDHECDNQQIDCEEQSAVPSWPTKELGNLKRYIDGPAHGR